MPINKALLDLAIRRQVTLEQLKSGQVRDFNKVFADISATVRSELAKVGELTDLNKQTVNRLLGTYKTRVHNIYTKQIQLFTPQLEQVAGVYASMEGIDIASSLTGGVKVASATPKQAFRLATTQAMSHSGETMNDFIGKLADGETSRVANTVRQGFFQGRTNQQIVKSIIGTKANRYKDGILEVSRRNAKAVIQTSVQHVASVGRMATWKANKDIVEKYQWVSTLDSKTSNICKGLDGEQYVIDAGPVPPIHVNCRSTTIAVMNPKFDFLSEGRTRSTEFGPVDAKKSYYDWLKDQDAGFQDKALGKSRAGLFRNGGLSPKQFKDLSLDKNFNPLSLDEMKLQEPEAFKKAFGGGAPAPVVKAPAVKVTTPQQTKQDVLALREKYDGLRIANEAEQEANMVTLNSLKTEQEQLDFLDGDFKATRHRGYELDGEMRKEAHEALFLPKELHTPHNKVVTNLGTYSGKFGSDNVVAAEFVGKMVVPKLVPTVSINKLNKRSDYNWLTKTANVRSDAGTSVHIHEIIHDIEIKHPDISARVKEFRENRMPGDVAQKLSKITGNTDFDANEWAYEDHWKEKGWSQYAGKEYDLDRTKYRGKRRFSVENRRATEVLTMGTERLFNDPIGFAQMDPEGFEFILSILRGF